MSQSNQDYEIKEYKIKIPFGYKIYKFDKSILNFDGLLKIKTYYKYTGGLYLSYCIYC